MNKVTPDQELPSLDLAYSLIHSPYDWILRRVTAVEQRIQGLLTQSTIALVGIPAIVSAIEGGELSWTGKAVIPGSLALAAFFFIVICGLCAFRIGKLTTIDPGVLIVNYENFDPPSYVGLDPTAFKNQLIQIASEDLHKNNGKLNKKALLADVMGFLLVVEILAGAAWGGVSLASSG